MHGTEKNFSNIAETAIWSKVNRSSVFRFFHITLKILLSTGQLRNLQLNIYTTVLMVGENLSFQCQIHISFIYSQSNILIPRVTMHNLQDPDFEVGKFYGNFSSLQQIQLFNTIVVIQNLRQYLSFARRFIVDGNCLADCQIVRRYTAFYSYVKIKHTITSCSCLFQTLFSIRGKYI